MVNQKNQVTLSILTSLFKFATTACMVDTTEQFVYNDPLFIDYTIDRSL